MTLEENVLAYLDGSLGEEESAELLHTLSVSPEKRALLDEHLRLAELNALGRKPFAVPAAAERELIARLPFLADAPKPVPFYARPMALLASSAVVLAVIGGLWWNANRAEGPASQSTTSLSHDVPSAVVLSGSNSVPNGVKDLKDNKDAKDVSSNSPTVHLVTREQVVKHNVASPVNVALNASNDAAALVQANASSNQPAGAISEALLKAADIPRPSITSPRTLHEIAFGVPDRLRPFSVGLSGAASGYSFPTLTGATNASIGMDPQLNVGYDITQWFAFGLEAGYTQFGKVTNTSGYNPNLDGTQYSALSYNTLIARTGTYYARATMHYTIDPADEYPIRLGAAGGYAFVPTAAPSAAVSAGITRTLGDDLSFDLDMVLSGMWYTPINDPSPEVAGVTGITHSDTRSQAPFTSAFGLRAGIRYRP